MKKYSVLFMTFFMGMLVNAQIIINEIMYNPPESGTDFLEYIEFLNTSHLPVNIKGYSITDAVIINFPDTTINPLSYFIICVDAYKLDSILGIKGMQWASGALRNTDEVITLLDENKNIVDSVHYYSSWYTLANGNGASLELCRHTADNSNSIYWRPSERNTTVELNGKFIMASPGLLNSVTCGDHNILVSDFKFNPAYIEIFTGEQVEWTNQNGLHNINGSQSIFSDNPESFGNGAPSNTKWSYIHKFNTPGIFMYQCDTHVSQGMMGIIKVINQDLNYPKTLIGLVTSTNNKGELDSINKLFALEGIVYGINLRPSGLQFTIIDQIDDGIAVFKSNANLGYTVEEGDLIEVKGRIGQFNGLAQIDPDSIILRSKNNKISDPTLVTSLNENTESQFVEMKKMTLVNTNEWTNDPTGFTVKITDGISNWDLRIDNDVDLHGSVAPVGQFNVKGIGTQFDVTSPYLDGYQLMPRYTSDIQLITSVNVQTKTKIDVFPNPMYDRIFIQSDQAFEFIQLLDLEGRIILTDDYKTELHLNINRGIYFLKLLGKNLHTIKLIKI